MNAFTHIQFTTLVGLSLSLALSLSLKKKKTVNKLEDTLSPFQPYNTSISSVTTRVNPFFQEEKAT